MRNAIFLVAVLVPPLFLAADPACAPSVNCWCPEITTGPSVAIELACTTKTPTLTLSGVCAGHGGAQSGQLVFGAASPGICHVDLRSDEGFLFSADVTFKAQDVPCGSDPQGCGMEIVPEGLAMKTQDGLAVLVAGMPCPDAGGD